MKSEMLEKKYSELELMTARDKGWISGFMCGCITVVIMAVCISLGVF
jgi:hypothetical protein